MTTNDTQTSTSGVKRELDHGDESHSASKRSKPSSGLTQHPIFWDSYGDVIIQVEDTLFKLQGTTLARQSEYFSKLLDDSEDEDVPKSKEVDDLPVHKISMTSVQDFEALLTATDSSVLVSYLLERPPFEVVASILRISTVLDFPKLRDYAVNCMKDVWSDKLDRFSTTPKWLEHSAVAVQLARQYDVPVILKRALYELVRGSIFLEGTGKYISKADMVLLARASDSISNEWWNIMLREKSTPCVQKQSLGGTSSICSGFPAIRSTLPGNADFLIHRAKDPIIGFTSAMNAPWHPVCQPCLEAKRVSWRKQRSAFWSKLDDWFELE